MLENNFLARRFTSLTHKTLTFHELRSKLGQEVDTSGKPGTYAKKKAICITLLSSRTELGKIQSFKDLLCYKNAFPSASFCENTWVN